MKEQPLVSVIIPVYNVERYLAQCLDSVINQTYPNLEIICVNDGSRDGSPDILRRYADEDARIQVIDKANGGVSRARNDALDCARGEYIMFVDSDDWVEPDACENAVNAMREYDADIVMWSYVSETENRSSRKVIFPETTVFEKEEVRAKLHRRFVGAMGEELSHPELVDSLCPVSSRSFRPLGSFSGFSESTILRSLEGFPVGLPISLFPSRLSFFPKFPFLIVRFDFNFFSWLRPFNRLSRPFNNRFFFHFRFWLGLGFRFWRFLFNNANLCQFGSYSEKTFGWFFQNDDIHLISCQS